MIEIPLTNSTLIAVIDDEDYINIGGYNWQLNKHTRTYFATSTICGKPTMLHYMIWPHKEGFEIDHRDGNGLNNQKSNFRYATHAQNNANKGLTIANTSGYKGICFDRRRNKWQAKICINYKQMGLGNYATKEEAARAYNLAAIKYHGEFARLNQITER